MPEQALVLLEAPDELRYLFQAPALRDVQGAGALLEGLSRFTLPALAGRREYGGASIVAGGREYVVAVSSAEAARRFLSEARRTFRARTVALALRGAAETVEAEALLTSFGATLQHVRLHLEQGTAPSTVSPAYAPELRLCDACRLLPAAQADGAQVICRACLNRRTSLADQTARLAVPGYAASLADAGEEDLAARPVWERWLRWMRDRGLRRSSDAGRDIAELAQQRAADEASLADAAGWRAVVIGRVNDFGHALEYLNDSQRVLRNAQRVNTLLDDALFEAATSVCRRDNAQPLGCDVSLVGGDRFVGIFPADAALAVVARATRAFEGQSAAATEGRRLSCSLGIGLAPAALPLGIAASGALRALDAARLHYLGPADAARGSWRSSVAIAAIDGMPPLALNLGELERALLHARTLRRQGLDAGQLATVVQAVHAGSPGQMALALARCTEVQRRALAAVWRDLEIDAAPAEQNVAGRRLFDTVAGLVPFAGLGLQRTGVTARGQAAPDVGRSA